MSRVALAARRFSAGLSMSVACLLSLDSSAALAQQSASPVLPPVEVAPPTPQIVPAQSPAPSQAASRKRRVARKPKQQPPPAVSMPSTTAPDVVSPTAIVTPAGQVASSITVVTDKDIQTQQYRSVPEALNTVPGLNVVQTGGPGGQTSVFMRGTNSNHTKVFIDGIDVGDPSTPNGAFDYAHLLKRISSSSKSCVARRAVSTDRMRSAA
jgi:vitamin B12 transporter